MNPRGVLTSASVVIKSGQKWKLVLGAIVMACSGALMLWGRPALIAAEVDVLAREGCLPSERRHAPLVERRPEVHGLAPNEDQLAVEVRHLDEDRRLFERCPK
jgi:hypothetical protein